MSKSKEVPFSVAKQIADDFDKTQVIIVTWDSENEIQTVTTYGRNRLASAQAAQGGNFVKEALGWPDQLCHDAPEWWQTNIEKIGKLADTVDNLLAAMSLPVSPKIHLDGLRDNLARLSLELKEIYQNVTGHDPWSI